MRAALVPPPAHGRSAVGSESPAPRDGGGARALSGAVAGPSVPALTAGQTPEPPGCARPMSGWIVLPLPGIPPALGSGLSSALGESRGPRAMVLVPMARPSWTLPALQGGESQG